MNEKNTSTAIPIVPVAVPVTPTEDAKVLRRKVYDAIEAVYDERRKCYARGLNGYHTDDTLAKNLGCAAQLVAKIREEFFGGAEPDEPTEDIKSFQSLLGQIDKALSECEKSIFEHILMAEGLKEQAKKVRVRMKDAEERLKVMCVANGWYH